MCSSDLSNFQGLLIGFKSYHNGFNNKFSCWFNCILFCLSKIIKQIEPDGKRRYDLRRPLPLLGPKSLGPLNHAPLRNLAIRCRACTRPHDVSHATHLHVGPICQDHLLRVNATELGAISATPHRNLRGCFGLHRRYKSLGLAP